MNLNDLLALSVTKNASDLHLSAGLPPVLRINGNLSQMTAMPLIEPAISKQLVYSAMTKEQQNEFEYKREIDFTVNIPSIANFRANAFYHHRGVAAVFRIIPNRIPTLDQLEMPPSIKNLLALSHGLILVTGPTGSGKSTTLAAMVNHLNEHYAKHIITIEDPIEFVHQSKKSLVSQRQLHYHTPDFTSALHATLREDPDVILVGEMRDLETIRLALTAAETGHLVLATLHTCSAPRAITRIVDVFSSSEKNVIRNMLSESLQAVICQTLVKNILGGRMAAFEIMLGTAAIRNLIREDKIAQMHAAIQTGGEVGMCTMNQYIQRLVARKQITLS